MFSRNALLRNICKKHFRQFFTVSRSNSRFEKWSPTFVRPLGAALTTPAQIEVRFFAKKAKDKKAKESKPKVQMTDEELYEVMPVDDLRSEYTVIIDGFRHELSTKFRLRSGAAIEELTVEFDNDEFKLKELAQISKKNPLLVTLNVSSFPDAIKPILKAINESGMNLNPQQEGTMIYIQIPKVTREHRELSAKGVKQLLNKAKDELKTVQNKFIRMVKDQQDSGVSEDLVFNACENIKYMADKAFHECEAIAEIKSKELLGEQ